MIYTQNVTYFLKNRFSGVNSSSVSSQTNLQCHIDVLELLLTLKCLQIYFYASKVLSCLNIGRTSSPNVLKKPVTVSMTPSTTVLDCSFLTVLAAQRQILTNTLLDNIV